MPFEMSHEFTAATQSSPCLWFWRPLLFIAGCFQNRGKQRLTAHGTFSNVVVVLFRSCATATRSKNCDHIK